MNRFRFWVTLGLSHQRRLAKAAGVSRVTLVCHPDTWAEIVEMSSEVVLPLKVEAETIGREDGLTAVSLSGVSLVRVLEITQTICQAESPFGLGISPKYSAPDRAVAVRVYLAIARSLNNIERYQTRGEPMPDIVIDDRPRPVAAS
jgi:hypothetical protein